MDWWCYLWRLCLVCCLLFVGSFVVFSGYCLLGFGVVLRCVEKLRMCSILNTLVNELC